MVALNAKNGRTMWSRPLASRSESSPLLDGGRHLGAEARQQRLRGGRLQARDGAGQLLEPLGRGAALDEGPPAGLHEHRHVGLADLADQLDDAGLGGDVGTDR
ncbi:MAG: hypothetical protein KY442_13495, partial [Proteobacteria bacterium]|nr:hypothetical protein [Pseudomonadota bacterium]